MTTDRAVKFLMTEIECLNEFREQAKLVEKPEKFLNFGYDCLSHLETKPDRLERLMAVQKKLSFKFSDPKTMFELECPRGDGYVFFNLTDLDTFLAEQEKGATD